MKHKKILAAILGTACFAILIGTFFLSRTPERTFSPEVTESVSSDSWNEKHTLADPTQTIRTEAKLETLPSNGSQNDDTQNIVSNDADQVIAELTPQAEKEKTQADTKPTTPPADTKRHEKLPGCDAPASELDTTAAKAQPEPEAPAASDPPASDAGESHDGQVYDPVFGWLTPSPAQGQITDNNGDINKQVGSMN